MKATMTVVEAASLLGIGKTACYDAIHRGEVPSLRIGHRILVPTAPLFDRLGLPYEPDAIVTTSQRPRPVGRTLEAREEPKAETRQEPRRIVRTDPDRLPDA